MFRRVDVRWHDLRHDYASRLLEHGVPLAQVRDLRGHASITTTEREDTQMMANLQIAAKLQRGRGFGSTAPTGADRRRPRFVLPGRSLTVDLKVDGYRLA